MNTLHLNTELLYAQNNRNTAELYNEVTEESQGVVVRTAFRGADE